MRKAMGEFSQLLALRFPFFRGPLTQHILNKITKLIRYAMLKIMMFPGLFQISYHSS